MVLPATDASEVVTFLPPVALLYPFLLMFLMAACLQRAIEMMDFGLNEIFLDYMVISRVAIWREPIKKN